MNRRNALKWLTASTAAVAGTASAAPGQTEPAPVLGPTRNLFQDPDFSKPMVGPWERLMTKDELQQTTVLADLILPKDENGPAASEVGVPEFINEWISAPYPDQKEACEIIRGGLTALNTAAFKAHGQPFAEVTPAQQTALLDTTLDTPFFKTFRQLCLGGYYTHSSTWKQLGYVGNISVGGPYPGVPQEILEQFGLAEG